MPPTRRRALITVHANYEGNPNFLLGTAPIYDLEAERRRPRRSSPSSCRSSTSRSRSRSRCAPARTTGCASRSRNHPGDAAGRRGSDLLGLPGAPPPRLPNGSRRAHPATGRLRRLATRELHGDTEPPSALPISPLIDNPTICTGQPLVTSLEVQTYQDPDHLARRDSDLPADHGMRTARSSNRCSTRAPRPTRPTPPPGLDIELGDPQFLASPPRPPSSASAMVTFPPG